MTGPARHSGPAVTLRGTSRRYGDLLALSALSLSLHRGTVTLVTGANGSGKTTLLRVVAGLLRPSAGTREAADRSLYLHSGAGARSVESARAAVRTAARLSGLPRGEAAQAAAAALDQVGLGRVADRAVGSYSSGQRARVSLAVALACPVGVVCLDEPTAHLDTEGVRLTAATIDALAGRGSAVLVASHDPAARAWPADARLRVQDGVVGSERPTTAAEALPA